MEENSFKRSIEIRQLLPSLHQQQQRRLSQTTQQPQRRLSQPTGTGAPSSLPFSSRPITSDSFKHGVRRDITPQQKLNILLQQSHQQNTNKSQNNSPSANMGYMSAGNTSGVNTTIYNRIPNLAQPQSRQYVLVPTISNVKQSLSLTNHPVPGRSPVPESKTIPGQIQLGQTYQFDVKRSPRMSYPSSIILKQSYALPSQSQRIPLKANDKGKFIPFTRFLVPDQRRDGLHAGHANILRKLPAPNQYKELTYSQAQQQELNNSVRMAVEVGQITNKRPITSPSTQNTYFKNSKSPPIKTQFQPNIMDKNLARTNQISPPLEQDPFDWDEYLKLTSSKAAPHTSFKHVEISLQNGFVPGMKLEVANKSDPVTYWVATLISTCGQLLLLRFDGYGDDRNTDFWADVRTADLHPIGWCAQNGKVLQPPEAIQNRHENWAEFLVANLIGARTAPTHLLSGPFKGRTVVEMIEPSMLLEVQDSQHPQHVWMADVLKNIGGRLFLRYKGLSEQDSKFDFWLFYLDAKLHQLGWGKEHGLTMKPPSAIRNKYQTGEQWAYVLSKSLKGVSEQNLVPACVFQDQVKFKPHIVKEKWKLAVLDPKNPMQLRPATIIKIVNKFFFLVELDNLEKLHQQPTSAFLCHSGTSGIFSINWCRKYRIPVTPPRGYNISEFDWLKYLLVTDSDAAPDACFRYYDGNYNFSASTMLEACNPFNPSEICVASVIAVHGNVLHLRLFPSESRNPGMPSQRNHIDCFVHASSQDIFPVGWCQSNNYPLSAPRLRKHLKLGGNMFGCDFTTRKIAVVQPEIQRIRDRVHNAQSIHNVINPGSNSKLWCPVVCFNSKCNTGVFINDHALSKVPRFVGPGNTSLVVKEVLSLLIGAAERPHKLLKDLEDFTVGIGHQPCIIKAKFEGKKYQATLHIINTAVQVADYFKSITAFLRCCPNLLSLEVSVRDCPLLCRKERGPGRPPSIVRLSSQRGRKKKLFGEKLKQPLVTGPISRQKLKNEFKSFLGKPGNRTVLTGEHIAASYENYCFKGILPQKRRLPSAQDDLRSSVEGLTYPSRIDLKSEMKHLQERMKLHKLDLKSNPLYWSPEEIVEFMETTECAPLAGLFTQHAIDGQSLLLLTLPVVQDCMDLKLGPALKLCRQIERIKAAFYENFADS